MQAQARALGAIVVDSTSGATNIVVTGEDPSASKVSKAKNATIYTEAEYKLYCDDRLIHCPIDA